ncbi:MAG: hypothetical protein WC421_07465 [Elusimicrobiales bacterium]
MQLLTLLLACGCARALEITAADRAGGFIQLSGGIEITGVRFSTDAFGGAVALALDNSRDGRTFANIRIMNKNLYGKLMAANAAQQAGKTDIDVKVLSARKLASPSRIANVDIAFDGELAATFGLLKTRGKSGTAYKMLSPASFKFKSGALRKRVRELVIQAGMKAAGETAPGKAGVK